MLQSVSKLERMSIHAIDGEIGAIKDVYFDDQAWVLRYLVVDTGGWLAGRRVLVSPLAVRAADWERRHFDVSLSRDQVRSSPAIDTDKPVSRQHEIEYFDHFAFPYYWSGPFMWGPVPFPGDTADLQDAAQRARRTVEKQRADQHLRSVNEVSGYHIEATDGSIGHIEDFLYDEQNWSLRYLVIDTRNWLPGRHVLVSTGNVEQVSWEERSARVTLSRGEVRNSPEFDSHRAFSAEDEKKLHEHGGTAWGQPTRGGQIR